MNTIVLLPVKNEGWILEYTLSVFSAYADYIIIADQNSIDSTKEICSTYSKVKIIENDRKVHSNEVRWDLLNEARKIKGENLILCIDADEVLSLNSFNNIKQKAIQHGPGTVFSLPWLQTWKNLQTQRVDSVWKNNIKSIAFFDDRTMDYEKTFVINDHTNRTPTVNIKKTVEILESPLIHLHFAAWNRAVIKQAWYRCSELIRNPNKARYINNKYSNGDDTTDVVVQPFPEKWLQGIPPIDTSILQSEDSYRRTQIYEWFETYSIKFFEPLNIWHIDDFIKRFIIENKRNPQILKYPNIIIRLNEFKNKMKGIIKRK